MGWDVKKAVTHIRGNARTSSGAQCARFTREAIEAGLEGGKVPRPSSHSAKDYGLGLQMAGFSELPGMCGGFQAGDVVVIDGIKGHPDGHMAMYDGHRWISDFSQNDYVGREGGLYPGNAYAKAAPIYRLYRWTGRKFPDQ